MSKVGEGAFPPSFICATFTPYTERLFRRETFGRAHHTSRYGGSEQAGLSVLLHVGLLPVWRDGTIGAFVKGALRPY